MKKKAIIKVTAIVLITVLAMCCVADLIQKDWLHAFFNFLWVGNAIMLFNALSRNDELLEMIQRLDEFNDSLLEHIAKYEHTQKIEDKEDEQCQK